MESICIAKDWLEVLSSEAAFFKKKKHPSLETVNTVLDLLERPDESFEYRIVVGGTAGKGTVCRRTEQTLIENGKTVLTLSSPHLQTPLERIRVNGRLVSQDDFGKGIQAVKDICSKNDIIPTYYEAIVLAGIVIGKKSGCEILVAEVGLGGEWDAVNAVRGKRISALTFIGEDHMDILGPKLSDVAQTKAGIFTKDTVFGVTYEQKYSSIIQKKLSTELIIAKGIKNKLNKKLAQKICKFILQSEFVMTSIKIPARWEKIQNIILDGSHAKPRFEFILPKVKKAEFETLVVAMAKNHNPESLDIILPYFKNVYWTTVDGDRGFWDPVELQKQFGVGEILEPTEIPNFIKSRQEKTLVTGSFYLCGKVRELFYPTEEIELSGGEYVED